MVLLSLMSVDASYVVGMSSGYLAASALQNPDGGYFLGQGRDLKEIRLENR